MEEGIRSGIPEDGKGGTGAGSARTSKEGGYKVMIRMLIKLGEKGRGGDRSREKETTGSSEYNNYLGDGGAVREDL